MDSCPLLPGHRLFPGGTWGPEGGGVPWPSRISQDEGGHRLAQMTRTPWLAKLEGPEVPEALAQWDPGVMARVGTAGVLGLTRAESCEMDWIRVTGLPSRLAGASMVLSLAGMISTAGPALCWPTQGPDGQRTGASGSPGRRRRLAFCP